ncbi:acetate uptake transporter [Geoalkalibacter sp.]|uniref:acetate uptake transporter n=1 Tax=Geoalkalibacter sp. TaxID=3041440 RepID=UPI00272E3A69|nr:acetate uptake transporter [Geoalkalibacter sp.]
MTDESICPFFGVNEDWCDVGCGYISPSDVHQIIRFCRAHHGECGRYQQLAARYPDQAPCATAAGTAREALRLAARRADTPPDELSEVKVLNAPRGASAAALPLTAPERVATSSPAPLGLLGWGLTIALLGIQQAALLPLDAMMIAMGLFYGGLAQIIAGIFEWRRHHSFAATAFSALGLFWLALVGVLALPRAGIGELPSALSLASFLTLWGLFSAVLCVGSLRLGRLLPLIFANFSLFLFLLALSEAGALPVLADLAGWQGLLTGVLAIYTGCAQVLNDVYRRRLFPT